MTDGCKMKDILAPEAIDQLYLAFGSDQDKERVRRERRARTRQESDGRHARRLRADRAAGGSKAPGRDHRNRSPERQDLDAQIVAAACAAGIDPTSEDFADLIRRVSEKVKEVAAAIHDMVDIVVAAINEAWQPMVDTLEEIQKLIEQYKAFDEPEEEDRHDGAVEALVTWLLPVPTLYELYGQGVDHGGLAHPV